MDNNITEGRRFGAVVYMHPDLPCSYSRRDLAEAALTRLCKVVPPARVDRPKPSEAKTPEVRPGIERPTYSASPRGPSVRMDRKNHTVVPNDPAPKSKKHKSVASATVVDDGEQ